MARLRFEIQGDRSGVSLPTYNTATFKLIQLLREMDSAISGKNGGFVGWYVTGLAKNGTLTLEIESRLKLVKRTKVQPKDTGQAVTQSFVTGFENIEIRGISPPYLSEFGLRKLEDMMHLMHKNGARGFIATAVDEQRSIAVTENAARTLRELIPPKREAIGTVEGMLETISIHRTKKFIVYDSLTHKGITCILRDRDEVFQSATDALGKKVVVSGLVLYNIKNEPLNVNVENIRILGANKRLPWAAELTGSDPQFTGDMTTDEYIRSIRRG